MMRLVVPEVVGEFLALIGSAIGAAVFAFAGAITEQAALQNLMAGNLTVGAWEVWMGTLALFVGVYMLGYREFWIRSRNYLPTG